MKYNQLEIAVMLVSVACVSLPTMAATEMDCYGEICASINLPDCANPDAPHEVTVEGSIEGGNSFSVSAYALYRNATWSYDANHLVQVSAGDLIDGNGFNWGNVYSNTYSLTSADSPTSYTFVFGNRSMGHQFQDVAVEGVLSLGSTRVDVPLDVKPASCPNPINVQQKGITSIAVLGTEQLPVSQINVSTVSVLGVSPVHIKYDDVGTPYAPFTGKSAETDCNELGGDGVEDLVLKFKTRDLVEAMASSQGSELLDRQTYLLTLSAGVLSNSVCGTTIYGEDVVRIIDNKLE